MEATVVTLGIIASTAGSVNGVGIKYSVKENYKNTYFFIN